MKPKDSPDGVEISCATYKRLVADAKAGRAYKKALKYIASLHYDGDVQGASEDNPHDIENDETHEKLVDVIDTARGVLPSSKGGQS